MTHVYVVIFPEMEGPVLEVHEFEPPVPEIAQLRVPEGEVEPVAPVTVAVKVIFPPKVGEPDAITKIAGVYRETAVEVEEETKVTAL